MSQEPWNYDDEMQRDRNFERGLVPKEFIVLLLVLAVLAIRYFLG
ncbi:MAG: hypothetical protein WBP55_00645 [Solirubrobacterales bacterium]